MRSGPLVRRRFGAAAARLERLQLLAPARPGDASSIDHRSAGYSGPGEDQRHKTTKHLFSSVKILRADKFGRIR
jgi:hypothetical protein